MSLKSNEVNWKPPQPAESDAQLIALVTAEDCAVRELPYTQAFDMLVLKVTRSQSRQECRRIYLELLRLCNQGRLQW